MNSKGTWKQTFCHGQKRGSLSGLKAAGEEEEEEEILLDAAAVGKDPKQKGLNVEEAIPAGTWER